MCKYHMGMTKRERNTDAQIGTESCHYQYSLIPWSFKIQKSGVFSFFTQWSVNLLYNQKRKKKLKYAENNYKQDSF